MNYSEYLTDEEIAILRKSLSESYLIGFLIFTIITALYLILIFGLSGNFSISFWVILCIIDLSILVMTYWSQKNLRLDISGGVKNLVEYQIVNKIEFWDREPEAIMAKMKYQLITKDKYFIVDRIFYDKLNANDWIVEHETPMAKKSLKLVKK